MNKFASIILISILFLNFVGCKPKEVITNENTKDKSVSISKSEDKEDIKSNTDVKLNDTSSSKSSNNDKTDNLSEGIKQEDSKKNIDTSSSSNSKTNNGNMNIVDYPGTTDKELLEAIKAQSKIAEDIINDGYQNVFKYNGQEFGKLVNYNSVDKIEKAFQQYCISGFSFTFMSQMQIKEKGGFLSIPLGNGSSVDYTNSKVINKTYVTRMLYVTISEEFMGDKENHTYIFQQDNDGKFKFSDSNPTNEQAPKF